MIDLQQYFMGRDRTHALALGADLRANALRTVDLVNRMLVLAKTAGVRLEARKDSGSIVSSGWRPPDVNAATPGAALRSKHLSCQACDLFDPEGRIDGWLMTPAGQQVLQDLGLWLEHPAATKGWSHVQTVPPGSGNRVFYP